MKKAFRSVKAAALSLPFILMAEAAMAAGGNMPWEAPVGDVEASITGPVLSSILALAIVGSGIAMTQSSSSGVQSFARLIFGGSIAAAGAFFLGLFGVGSGALL